MPSKEYKTVRVPVNSSTPGEEVSYSEGTNLQDRGSNSPPKPQSSSTRTEYQAGQNVEYKPIGGPNSNTSVSTGTIERVITSKQPAGDTKVSVNASEDNPRYEIKNNHTGKKSAINGANIIGEME